MALRTPHTYFPIQATHLNRAPQYRVYSTTARSLLHKFRKRWLDFNRSAKMWKNRLNNILINSSVLKHCSELIKVSLYLRTEQNDTDDEYRTEIAYDDRTQTHRRNLNIATLNSLEKKTRFENERFSLTSINHAVIKRLFILEI